MKGVGSLLAFLRKGKNMEVASFLFLLPIPSQQSLLVSHLTGESQRDGKMGAERRGLAAILICFGVVTSLPPERASQTSSRLPDWRSPALSGIRTSIPRDISRKDIFPKFLGSVGARLESEAISSSGYNCITH